MQNDTNTYGYNQWFYFSIKNAKANTKYKFKIANFVRILSFRKNLTLSLIMAFNPSYSPLPKQKKKEMDGTEEEVKYHIIFLIIRN